MELAPLERKKKKGRKERRKERNERLKEWKKDEYKSTQSFRS